MIGLFLALMMQCHPSAVDVCEQAVADACVDMANPDGSTDCEDDALRGAYNLLCGAQKD